MCGMLRVLFSIGHRSPPVWSKRPSVRLLKSVFTIAPVRVRFDFTVVSPTSHYAEEGWGRQLRRES